MAQVLSPLNKTYGVFTFGSLPSSIHVIHCASRSYTWKAWMLCVVEGAGHYIEEFWGSKCLSQGRKCAINKFWTKKSAGRLEWGSRGSRQIIYVRILPNIWSVFGPANRPNINNYVRPPTVLTWINSPGSKLAKFPWITQIYGTFPLLTFSITA